ncbi:guanine nucleotide-binding protein G(s) subunit alpha [Grus japonensis]|uniref:Guanine nucleotide-binding protein G(S) subunit alpha n=1 Tax=Grus japonensis TaxID=30415 RepID=A0ABC9XIF8_GRUJA
MGLCYSLRSRLAAAHPSAPYGGRVEADIPPSAAAGEHGDPQVRHRLRQDLLAKERADKKRSKSIDKTLKAEKREYKQTHRLLLLVPLLEEVPHFSGVLRDVECMGVVTQWTSIKIAEYPRDQAVYFIRVEAEGAPSSPPSLHDERSHEAVQQLTSHLLVE